MRSFMRAVAYLVLCALAIGSLAGCNTIRGVGKDIQAGGRAIERAGQN